MLKKVQVKIILFFAVIGIIIISALSLTYINNLKSISTNSQRITNEAIENEISQVKKLTLIYLGGFVVATVVFGAVTSKFLFAPIKGLIKNAEQAQESENEATRQKKQLETILLHMTDGIIAFDMDGNIIHINLAAKTLLNIDKENNFSEIFDKFDVDINLEKIIYLENWTSSERKINVEERTINLFFAPFRDENERPGGVIVVIQDITEHVRLDTMRKRFVADVSHELKTPITSIMGYADTLIESDVDKETSNKFLLRISSEAERMSRLVSDLLILSKYDTSKMKVEKTEFDLGELVKYNFEVLDIEMKKKNQVGECFVTSNVPPVYADKGGIERVIINVLSNAIKYTPEGGSIKVYVGFVYNDAYIKIIDTGIGIPKEDLDKIFERFYRVDKARTREMGGTGLGLSIAKEILDQNDSMIDIKSEVGKGTEVVIRIPTRQVKSNKQQDTEE